MVRLQDLVSLQIFISVFSKNVKAKNIKVIVIKYLKQKTIYINVMATFFIKLYIKKLRQLITRHLNRVKICNFYVTFSEQTVLSFLAFFCH